MLDVSASHNPIDDSGALFIVNRSQTEMLNTEVVWQSAAPSIVKEAWQLSGSDPKAVNTFETPNNITAQPLNNVAIQDSKLALQLPPLSFTAVSLNA
jgi:alpha-N-arabinofuranosidase